MSDNEVESFEITDWDLENEFNTNRNRGFRQTKNQQIYGIWANDSGGEEEQPSFSGNLAKKSYKTPVNFVAGGIQQAGKKKEEKKDEAEEDENEGPEPFVGSSSDEEVDIRPSFGSGGGKTKVPQGEILADVAGLRAGKNKRGQASVIGKGIGDWEKYTKGIGAKLLLQMGYQPGKGLGRDLQGRQTIIEAHKRKGRGAIGAYGQEGGKNEITAPGSEEEEDENFKEQLCKWRKGDGNRKKKVKYVYKSVDEVLEEGKTRKIRKDDSKISKVKVIDMTGPEQRVLSGYHAIHGQQHPVDDWEVKKDRKYTHFAQPELLNNLNVLVDMSEQAIIRNDRNLRHEYDRVVALKQEEETLSQLMEKEENQIKILTGVLELIELLETKAQDKEDPLTLEFAAESFLKLQNEYYEEYKLYELSNLSGTMVVPLVKEELKEWQPLEQPRVHMELFKKWKDILEMNDSQVLSTGGPLDPYHKLVWETWMPSMRKAVSTWSCRNCECMIEFLEHWLPLTPGWILDNLRDQLIMPKLQQEVEEWNPLTDTVPIHAWIHPWLPLLGTHLEIVYPTIRQKLSKALVNWHPSDSSAKMILQPWIRVFSKGSMEAFLIKNIFPKLQLALQEFMINPHQQHLDQWNWVMSWEELLPAGSMVSMLEQYFFPKWLQVLVTWLKHAPNYAEITKWYMGWKNMFSEQLLAHAQIKDQFNKALDLMNRAVSSPGQPLNLQPGAKESVSYLTNMERTQQGPNHRESPSRKFESIAEAVRTASQIPQGFKELIEKRCEERGILFIPLPNRWHEAKQVYRCGKVQMYIDRSVIFVQRDNIWVATSLQNLLDMAV